LGTKPSIAVLPFLDLDGDPAQTHLCDGVSEDIITELSRFPTLLVIARNSSFRYRGEAVDLQRVGRELGVRFVAEGSVRRIGERLRISAQLVEAATGNHLWASHYDCAAAEVASVQDEIIRAIATTLGYRIEAAGRARTLRPSPDALSAHDLVLRSEALFLRHTKEDNAEARRLAERAIALDSNSALAHAQLGWTHCMDFISNWVDGRAEALEAAFALAQRAVLLDDADCRARWLLGNVHLYRREFDAARDQLHAAMELNPNDVEACGIYGLYLTCIGDPLAALKQFDLAKRLNSFEFNWVIWYRGIALFSARRYDEAVATLRRVHNPHNEVRLWLAASLAGAGSLAEAKATLAQFVDVAEREMAHFPGRDLVAWQPYLGGCIEYREAADFEHLCAALRAAGLR
jgi:TolB-like protein